jgi:hypothetical protein
LLALGAISQNDATSSTDVTHHRPNDFTIFREVFPEVFFLIAAVNSSILVSKKYILSEKAIFDFL